MNNDKDIYIERIRDAMAGAVLGAVMAVVILLLSIVGSALKVIVGAEFAAMAGGTFVGWFFFLTLVGAGLGYGFGYYTTQEQVIRNSISNWLRKNNSDMEEKNEHTR